MDIPSASWLNTTHDWAASVDLDHLERIRRDPVEFAPGGSPHLVLEVAAYAADEAEYGSGARCVVTLHPDGSVSVADDGRGTDTRLDDDGGFVKKPIMASKDLRFFDSPGTQRLPDGQPRRGMSVVAALSAWVVHTNRRHNGAWTQRYEHGVPVTGLEPVPGDGTTGTLVHFRPRASVRGTSRLRADALGRLLASWPRLAVQVVDRRT
ncbi:ATP-binding protein [Streptomyces sp. NPDC058622]|uniref:ATP-binding protein n=1 Tax=Streptomyces sp. NPDC058622 TaxID=3346562 RepID=UPI003652AA1B